MNLRVTRREPLRLMSVHAHPDDESSKGAATLAKYAAEGADVLVVTCTGGERGSVLNPAMDRPEVRDDPATQGADLRRRGGQAVDLHGPALTVLERTGRCRGSGRQIALSK
ncbi:LmbE family N-acetylglucosaminyl deacetylase [Actinomadura coerulea]|uniref:LmbE family N-acetylglucosaminyl deacetylase n=1 Tax=Actinomadura coerulea TaxID=46159 RepID=A0A7X0FWE2_9ACTN|nr:LmbE family N-acetylglucosaminyl deacetylase [Actinomadura coerulea]GGQ45797.1 hypothetical protein GCM10010187_75120 [Actinomadura coerulea]